MKLNWGSGIAIFIALFIAFMVYMVVKSSGENTDLVATDYYARETAFQKSIDSQENAEKLEESVATTFTSDGNLEITFPNIAEGDTYEGRLIFMRPSDKELDLEFEVSVDSAGKQHIPLNKFKEGLYHLNVEWVKEQKNYVVNKKIVLP